MKKAANGKEQMNPTSSDPVYTELLANLRKAHRALAQAIEPKVIRIWLFKAIAICGNRLVIGGTTGAKSAMKFQGVRWEARRLGMHAVKKD